MAPALIYPLRFSPFLLQFLAYIGAPGETRVVADQLQCGRQMARNPRIMGGEDAYHGEFPWMVSIRYKKQHYCGGALIAKRWVLTASHCLYRFRNETRSFTVVAGDWRQDKTERPETEEEFTVDKIATHPEFTTRHFANDIALVRLKIPVSYDTYKQPVCIPDQDDDLYIGREATVSGWGWLSEPNKGGKKSNILQKLNVKVVDNRECTMWYREANYPFTFQPAQLCAGYKEGGKDSCQGDSGGPLVLREGEHYKVIGLVSSGVGCGRPMLPGLYTRVAMFIPWIKKIVLESKNS